MERRLAMRGGEGEQGKEMRTKEGRGKGKEGKGEDK